jgi:hypothetical protein
VQCFPDQGVLPLTPWVSGFSFATRLKNLPPVTTNEKFVQ